jgi:FKBP-type peptidyl-prolyl cis-trans isomerase
MRIRRFALVCVMASSFGFAACGNSEPAPPAATPAPAPPPAPAGIPAPPDVAAPPADATKTKSGLAWKVLKAGTGTIHPTAASTVKVNYTGWQTNGLMFDSSVVNGNPIEFPLSNVIPGWIEGLQLMVIGEKRRFWIPGMLAYDAPGSRPDAPRGMLVFDIELLDIK